MTGKLWASEADPFRAGEAAQDGSEPWNVGRDGQPREFELIPAADSGDRVWLIPYLQNITLNYNSDGTELGMICHSSDLLILITGRGLRSLAKLISQKKVDEIRVEDRGGKAAITSIGVIERGSIYSSSSDPV